MALLQLSKRILSEFGSDCPGGIRHNGGQQPAGRYPERHASGHGCDIPRKRSIVFHTVQRTFSPGATCVRRSTGAVVLPGLARQSAPNSAKSRPAWCDASLLAAHTVLQAIGKSRKDLT